MKQIVEIPPSRRSKMSFRIINVNMRMLAAGQSVCGDIMGSGTTLCSLNSPCEAFLVWAGTGASQDLAVLMWTSG